MDATPADADTEAAEPRAPKAAAGPRPGARPSGSSPARRRAKPAEKDERPRSWRPAPIHRYADLSQGAQIAFTAIIVALAVVPILSAVIVLRQGWRPLGDNALIGMRARDVLTGHLPLVGQPSTGENFGSGVESNHPGPIEFYVIAPVIALFGPTVGLALGAALINAAALVGVGWLAFRRGGMELMVIATVVAALLGRSLGGNFLHDPISSNVGAMMALTLLFAVWSIVAGDLRTLPVFVLVGTFALQDHLSYLGTGSPLILLAIGMGTWWIFRIRARTSDSSWLKPRLIASGVIAGVLWLPVVLDQLFGSHNLTAIFKTFTTKKSEGAGAGLGFAAKRVAESLAPWPIFSRKVAPLGWLHTPAMHEKVGGYVVLFVVIGFGIWFFRQRRTDMATMSLVVAVACAAGFYTAVKLPPGAGVKAANLRWMWTVSAFAWVALAWMLWTILPTLWKEVLQVPAIIFGGTAVALALASVVGSVGLDTDRDGRIAESTSSLIAKVERSLPKGRYRVKYAGNTVGLAVGPALVHDLDDRGDTLYVDLGPFSRAYASHREYDDQEVDGTLLVTAEANGSFGDGVRLVGRQTFPVPPGKQEEPETIRVYLEPTSRS